MSRTMAVSLSILPDEVLLNILLYLEIPDLLQTSRTCCSLRSLASDPLLHQRRRRLAAHDLAICLAARSSKASISPPNAWIWLSKTNVLTRSISKSLIRIRLAHNLDRRPSIQDLVDKAILPACCVHPGNISNVILRNQEDVRKQRLRDRLARKLERRPAAKELVELNILPEECSRGSGKGISPALVETRRKVMREGLKDGLRAWIERRAREMQRRYLVDEEFEIENASVKTLVRRFKARIAAIETEGSIDLEKRRAQARWGREVEIQRRKEEKRQTSFYSADGNVGGGDFARPTRAHVLGLRRFWEGVVKAAAAG